MELGIAASALQFAGAGFQLVKTLHSCASTFTNAEKEVLALATEVSLIANALDTLGHELDKDREISSAMRHNIWTAMRGCQTCFNELMRGMAKVGSNKLTGNDATIYTSSVKSRAQWVLSKSKAEALKRELSQHKITLMLMLGILATASDRRTHELVKENGELLRRLMRGGNSKLEIASQPAPSIATATATGAMPATAARAPAMTSSTAPAPRGAKQKALMATSSAPQVHLKTAPKASVKQVRNTRLPATDDLANVSVQPLPTHQVPGSQRPFSFQLVEPEPVIHRRSHGIRSAFRRRFYPDWP